MHYAKMGPKAAMVYEISLGMADGGADLSWLSQYPFEKEVLLAPCTLFEVTGNYVDGSVVVMKLRPATGSRLSRLRLTRQTCPASSMLATATWTALLARQSASKAIQWICPPLSEFEMQLWRPDIRPVPQLSLVMSRCTLQHLERSTCRFATSQKFVHLPLLKSSCTFVSSPFSANSTWFEMEQSKRAQAYQWRRDH